MRSRSTLLVMAVLACGDQRDAPAAAVSCEQPPAPPYGYEVGDTVEGLEFLDCDDQPVSLHDLCGARVGIVVNFYGWCPSCYDYVELAADLDRAHRDQGLRALVVVTQDPLEQPADARYCDQVKRYFGLEATVVYDPEGLLEAYGTTDFVMLTDHASKIVFKRDDASPAVVGAAVAERL